MSYKLNDYANKRKKFVPKARNYVYFIYILTLTLRCLE